MNKKTVKKARELVKLLRYQNELPAKIREIETSLVDIKQALSNAADMIESLLKEKEKP